MDQGSDLHIIALAGGSGTRFWPLSRRKRPKQLLRLVENESLLEATFSRVERLASPERWWMVVGRAHAGECAKVASRVPEGQTLVEPVARNTAPAIALSLLHLMQADEDALAVILPADHYVRDKNAFAAAVERAVQIARSGAIVTLGIQPSYAETGYGYIQRGAPDARGSGGYEAVRFCEKPDKVRAKAFLAQGDFYWNAGIFVMRARTFFEEMKRQLPRHSEQFEELRAHVGRATYDAVLKEVYAALEPVSVDYGIMEGAKDVVVVPAKCGWSDVGSFRALPDVLGQDRGGNVGDAKLVGVEARDNVVFAEDGHLVALLGVSEHVVIHTPDATLVAPLARAQEVRTLVMKLLEDGEEGYL